MTDAPDGILYAGTYDNGVLRSTDDGTTWLKVNEGISNPTISDLFATRSNVIHANGFWKSTDQGLHWSTSDVTGAHLVYDKKGNLLKLGGNRSVQLSTDDGLTWSTQGHMDFSGYVISPNNTLFSYGDQGIKRSTDYGKTWENAGEGIWGQVKAMAADSNGVLYVGKTDAYANSGEGMFISTDDGKSWQRDNSGIPEGIIRSIAVDKQGFVHVGTEHYGTFRNARPIPLSSVKSTPIDPNISLYPFHPNPARTASTSTFHLEKAQNVRLSLYDPLGRELTTIAQGYKNRGSHSFTIDVNQYPPGSYFIILRADDSVYVQKLTISK